MDVDRAIAGEKMQDFPWFTFPAVDKDRTIRFMGRWINIYNKTTREIKENEDDVSKETDYKVPSGCICEVAGGKPSSVQFL
jgi:hypothetical protein